MRPRTMAYVRAVGWAAFAAAPVLLTTLAVAASRPDAPGSLVSRGAWAAWLSGALAFFASVLHTRGATRPSRMMAAIAGLTVAAWCAFVIWVSART